MITGNRVLAASQCQTPAAILVSIQGTVTIDDELAALNQSICTGAVLRVDMNSRAGVRLKGTDTVVRIDAGSEFVINESESNSTILNIVQGVIYLFTRHPESFRVTTPYVNAAVDGTEFVVSVQTGVSEVIVVEGKVRISNDFGEVILTDSESGISKATGAPVRSSLINPFDAVQWALYYPRLAPDGPENSNVTGAIEFLESGRVDDATGLLDLALQENPDDTAALSVKSMIAVTTGRYDVAQELATRAITGNPLSAIAHTALSYTQQANFQLDSALVSAHTAVGLDTGNAYNWARLAELQAATGDFASARQSAEQAVELQPELSRTQSVLGFVNLSLGEIAQAAQSFAYAIDLDPADPLPRLGSGLVHMRRNNIRDGRADMEVAAILDPGNALIRSYLGKAYFAEQRDELAALQLDIAKRIDANDPTAWLYGAVQKQARNRPVDALGELRESIALNDNRAVYRSRLALDEDLSARQARLGIIYNDLGFEQAALLEGWKSLSISPSNFSAHRLLADSYIGVPRHDLARDSELLQAQMLQPLNVVPVQTRLTTDGLSLINDTNPANVGFNEFTRLYVADNLLISTNGAAGSNDTYYESISVSGITDSFSYSLGQSHFETDGVRTNNDSDQDFYNVFAQYSINHDTNVQFEFRRTDKVEGFRPLYFDPDLFFPGLRQSNADTSYRVGIRHNLNASQILLGTFTDVVGETTLDEQAADGTQVYKYDIKDKFNILETRHIFEGSSFHLNTGFSYIDGDSSNEGIFGTEILPTARTSVDHLLLYTYADISIRNNVSLQLGVSHDDYKDSAADFSQINPKLGLLWNITPSTVLRAAAFETVKRPFTASQTMEPTNVGGFNQFFYAINGSKTSRIGIGLDHQVNDAIAIGIEYSKRKLRIPIGKESPFATENEKLARMYLYWSPAQDWAFSTEPTYEHFGSGATRIRSENFSDMSLTKLPIELRYFRPNGFFARVKATYVRQHGNFSFQANPQEIRYSSGRDTFVVTNFAIGYRLRRQRGIVSLEVRNLFDNNFRFQESGRVEITEKNDAGDISLERQLFANVAVSF